MDTTSEEVDSGIRSEDMDTARMMDKRLGGKFLAPLTAKPVNNSTELKPLGRVDQIRRQFDVQKVLEGEEEQQMAKKPPVKGFTLTGTGSMFLKKKITTPLEDSAPKSITTDTTVQPSVKGILRDSSLTDVHTRPRDLGSETEKSVRFSLFNQSPDQADKNNVDDWPNSPKDTTHQRPSSALNKNLITTADSEDTSTDEDFEDENHVVIEDIEGNDEDAWTPRRPCEIKVMTSVKQPTVTEVVEAGNNVVAPPETTNQFVDLQPEMKARRQAENQRALEEESSRFDAELRRIREANEMKLEEFVVQEEMALQMMLEAKREEIEIDKQRSLTVIESQLEAKLQSVRAEIEESYSLDSFRNELKQEFEVQKRKVVEEHRASVSLLEKNHREILADLERDLKSQEALIKKEYANKKAELKSSLTHELETERLRMRETGDDRLYEKLRCEKRLLEDKYRCLKDRYNRLKTDVKLSVEKRNNRRRDQQLQANPTESDKRLNSSNKIQSGAGEKSSKQSTHSRHTHPTEDTTSISISETTVSQTQPRMNYSAGIDDSDSEAFFLNSENQRKSIAGISTHKPPRPPTVLTDAAGHDEHSPRGRKKLYSRTKSASTSRLHSSEACAAPCTPVENLRRQLKKLEDLEEQFPENTLEATYHLRYPFGTEATVDYENRSSELEFFKHRIHLERDALGRAKANLKSQRDNFRAKRDKLLHQHYTVEELMAEEKELTEMEVNLHRTRALLGEKVIRLRHLEQSLQRFMEHKNDATTLSDLSSHSSSGFSSTDFMMSVDGVPGNALQKGRRSIVAVESTSDILKNLETLNSEIREIWEILKQTTNASSSGHYYTSELDWSFNASSPPHLPLTQQSPLVHDNAQSSRNFSSLVSQSPVAGQYTSTLVERTRDLRNWLRQAKQEHLLAQKHTQI